MKPAFANFAPCRGTATARQQIGIASTRAENGSDLPEAGYSRNEAKVELTVIRTITGWRIRRLPHIVSNNDGRTFPAARVLC